MSTEAVIERDHDDPDVETVELILEGPGWSDEEIETLAVLVEALPADVDLLDIATAYGRLTEASRRRGDSQPVERAADVDGDVPDIVVPPDATPGEAELMTAVGDYAHAYVRLARDFSARERLRAMATITKRRYRDLVTRHAAERKAEGPGSGLWYRVAGRRFKTRGEAAAAAIERFGADADITIHTEPRTRGEKRRQRDEAELLEKLERLKAELYADGGADDEVDRLANRAEALAGRLTRRAGQADQTAAEE